MSKGASTAGWWDVLLTDLDGRRKDGFLTRCLGR